MSALDTLKRELVWSVRPTVSFLPRDHEIVSFSHDSSMLSSVSLPPAFVSAPGSMEAVSIGVLAGAAAAAAAAFVAAAAAAVSGPSAPGAPAALTSESRVPVDEEFSAPMSIHFSSAATSAAAAAAASCSVPSSPAAAAAAAAAASSSAFRRLYSSSFATTAAFLSATCTAKFGYVSRLVTMGAGSYTAPRPA